VGQIRICCGPPGPPTVYATDVIAVYVSSDHGTYMVRMRFTFQKPSVTEPLTKGGPSHYSPHEGRSNAATCFTTHDVSHGGKPDVSL
jgi:hypothetical protein